MNYKKYFENNEINLRKTRSRPNGSPTREVKRTTITGDVGARIETQIRVMGGVS